MTEAMSMWTKCEIAEAEEAQNLAWHSEAGPYN